MKQFFEAKSNLRRYITFPNGKWSFQTLSTSEKRSVECLLPCCLKSEQQLNDY